MNGADKIQMAELEAMKKSALAPHETRLATSRGHAGVIWIANQGWKMVESKQNKAKATDVINKFIV